MPISPQPQFVRGITHDIFTDTVYCGDDQARTFAAIGVLGPPNQPVLTGSTSGGSLADGTYHVELTYVNAQSAALSPNGGTLPSQSQSVTITGGGGSGSIVVTSPAAAGNNSLAATGYNVYVQNGSNYYGASTTKISAGVTVTTTDASGNVIMNAVAIGVNFTITSVPPTSNPPVPVASTATGAIGDTALTWTQQGGLPGNPGSIQHMLRDGTHEAIIYTVADNGLYKTWNGGLNWAQLRSYNGGGRMVGYGFGTPSAVSGAFGIPFLASNASRQTGFQTPTATPNPKSLKVVSGGTIPNNWQSYGFNDSGWTDISTTANAAGGQIGQSDSTTAVKYAQPIGGFLGANGDILLVRQPFSVAALGAPSSAPTLSAGGTGGTLTAGTYTAGYTFVTGSGKETPISATATVVVAAGQQITVTLPSYPVDAQSWNLYCSVAGGSTLYLVSNTSLFPLGAGDTNGVQATVSANPSTSAAQPPASDTSASGSGVTKATLFANASFGTGGDNVQLMGVWVNGVQALTPGAPGNPTTVQSADVTKLLLPNNGQNIIAAEVKLIQSPGFNQVAYASWRIDVT